MPRTEGILFSESICDFSCTMENLTRCRVGSSGQAARRRDDGLLCEPLWVIAATAELMDHLLKRFKIMVRISL